MNPAAQQLAQENAALRLALEIATRQLGENTRQLIAITKAVARQLDLTVMPITPPHDLAETRRGKQRPCDSFDKPVDAKVTAS